MEQQPTSRIINLDGQAQGFNDFDEVAPSQPPINDTPTSSTSKSEKGKKWAKRAKTDEKIMWDVKFELGRIANALKTGKSKFIGNELFDEIMTLSDLYTDYDLGWAYDYLLQNLPLVNGCEQNPFSLGP